MSDPRALVPGMAETYAETKATVLTGGIVDPALKVLCFRALALVRGLDVLAGQRAGHHREQVAGGEHGVAREGMRGECVGQAGADVVAAHGASPARVRSSTSPWPIPSVLIQRCCP